ncbi:hypothetical protein BURMUCGD1_6085 [Burkholderia multivorans CGD1]|nr:hypothetical protein BURMUCGD1_6085 [Burkholderia multivorans CGD1]
MTTRAAEPIARRTAARANPRSEPCQRNPRPSSARQGRPCRPSAAARKCRT